MPVPWKSTIRRQETNFGPPSQDALDQFQSFYEATSFQQATQSFSKVLDALEIQPGPFHIFFPKFKNRLQRHLPYKFQAVWGILEKKSKLDVYGKGIASNYNVLVVGAGPCGLRTAIETQFLGAQTLVVDKRNDFTRNNVLKLWKFLIEDLKSLGIKNFYGKFSTGSINHVGIKTLQLVLSKVCLMIGVKIVCPITFKDLSSPNESGKGWTATFTPENHEVNQYNFDMIVVASGKNVPIDGFDRYSLNAKLSIAVTANFVNNRTKEEQSVEQIAGLSKQYNQQFFASIEKDKGISLENIVYFKGETHYFVMTATRKSLLNRGVLVQNEGDRDTLVSSSNINKHEMYKYAIDAAEYSTNALSQQLPTREFALDHSGNPDVSVFDFTDLYCANNASRVKMHMDYKLIMASVGDSLLQPFWPEGTGCARGFLSAFNAAWMLRRYAEGMKTLQILSERENLYKLLKQTTDDSGGVLKNEHKLYTINPNTRYKHVSQKTDNNKISRLYEKPGVYNIDEPTPRTETDHPVPIPAPRSAVGRLKNQTISKLSAVINFPKKVHRARNRKTTMRHRSSSGKDSSRTLPPMQKVLQVQKVLKACDEIPLVSRSLPVGYTSPENITSTSAHETPTTSVVSEKTKDEEVKVECDGDTTGPTNSTITSSDANLALKTLQTYAGQMGLDYGMLSEFEKIMNNSPAHCKEVHFQ